MLFLDESKKSNQNRRYVKTGFESAIIYREIYNYSNSKFFFSDFFINFSIFNPILKEIKENFSKSKYFNLLVNYYDRVIRDFLKDYFKLKKELISIDIDFSNLKDYSAVYCKLFIRAKNKRKVNNYLKKFNKNSKFIQKELSNKFNNSFNELISIISLIKLDKDKDES